MSEQDEANYRRGQRSAWRNILNIAIRELNYDQDDCAFLHKLIAEREAAIAALRRLCSDYGDNNWPDNMYLSDIIEKHLHPWNR